MTIQLPLAPDVSVYEVLLLIVESGIIVCLGIGVKQEGFGDNKVLKYYTETA